MKYIFNVGRALKLNTELGINILDGDLTASALVDEHNKYLDTTDKKDLDQEYLKGLRNTIQMEEWKYATTIMPYFIDGEFDIDEITFEQIQEFHKEYKKVYASAFRGVQLKEDSGK